MKIYRRLSYTQHDVEKIIKDQLSGNWNDENTCLSTCDPHNSIFVINHCSQNTFFYNSVVKSLTVVISAIKDQPKPAKVHKLDKCAHERSGGVPMARPSH